MRPKALLIAYGAAAVLLAAVVWWSYREVHPGDAEHAGGEEPLSLLAGIGTLHHPIRTKSAAAQAYFDQGLSLVYAFEFRRAIESFKRASELDPTAAMPLWGIALASGSNYNAPIAGPAQFRIAIEELADATKLCERAPTSGEECALIQALSKRFSREPQPDQASLARDYAAAMGKVHRAYPNDPDAAVIYAESLMEIHPWAMWSATGKPANGTLEAVCVLEATLHRWPTHIGANHLLIHATEGSPHPERAMDSAKKTRIHCPSLQPPSPHARARIFQDRRLSSRSENQPTGRGPRRNASGPGLSIRIPAS